MTAPLFGRIVFGASAVLYGVVALMRHDSGLWQGFLTVAQVVGGAGLLYPRTTRVAAIAVGVVFGWFSLACIPGIIRAPATYVQYGTFFEQFAVVCGALAVLAATETYPARSAILGRIARVGLGLCAISFAVAQVVYLTFTASLVPAWIPPAQTFWVNLTTIAFGLAAVALLTDRGSAPAARLVSLMLALFGVLVWVPHLIAKPEAFANWSEFAETFLIAAAAWLVAGLAQNDLDQRTRGYQHP